MVQGPLLRPHEGLSCEQGLPVTPQAAFLQSKKEGTVLSKEQVLQRKSNLSGWPEWEGLLYLDKEGLSQ